jgi:hypothetical protein
MNQDYNRDALIYLKTGQASNWASLELAQREIIF